MTYYIYDLEVFRFDWIAVFKSVDGEDYHVIHNNTHELKKFIIEHRQDVLIGFNNKNYDDWILQSMLMGGDNETIKNHNDWIIGGNNGWEFPFIQFQKKKFKSADLRDDLPMGLSLKAIEANMGNNIVESEVDFNINRPLTPLELQQTIYYCTTDVDNTTKLFKVREKYINSKKQVAQIKNIDETEAVGLTNAKLTARFLDARATQHKDEFEYVPPDELIIRKYLEPVEFFKEIDYSKKLKTDVAGVPHIYAWGGLHGARNNYFMKSCEEYRMVTIDVGSYYPSMIIQYGYSSRNIPDVDGYKNVYETRMNAKHNGDKATADALKLVLNTFYGALKNKYNALYDPRMANSICITGQLFLTDLIEKLETVDGFELIQSNTDGIIIRYPIAVEKEIEAVVSEWEHRTRLNMEYTVIHAIAQKDVNNYIMKAGETYLVKDGEHIVTEPDKGKIKSKGGYVSLYEGGDFKNNSMTIIHKAIGDYFLNDIPVEKTINECDELIKFQIIAKTGSTYDGTFHIVDGEHVKVQRVNRVYATTNPRYGTLVKVKNNKEEVCGSDMFDDDDEELSKAERKDKIASLPEHCIIDNDNRLTINDIDKSFYIDLAKKRVNDYLGIKESKSKTKKEVVKMATKKAIEKEVNEKPEATNVSTKIHYEHLNIYQKIILARQKFLEMNVKKSGVNRFAKFKYFELEDIVPPMTQICLELGLVALPSFGDCAVLTVINTDKPEERETFVSPMRQLSIISAEGKNKMNELQGLGSEQTYQRRYLYMMFLDIVENDAIDATIGEDDEVDETPKATKPATPEKRESVKKELINNDGKMTETQVKSIKAGLKILQDKDENRYANYIVECVAKTRSGLTKSEAEALLIEIGDKANEE